MSRENTRWNGSDYYMVDPQQQASPPTDQLTVAIALAQDSGRHTLTIKSKSGNSVTFCVNHIQTGAHRLFPTMAVLRVLVSTGNLTITRVDGRACEACRAGDRAKDEPRLIKLRHRGHRS